jgi:hypothetical protein
MARTLPWKDSVGGVVGKERRKTSKKRESNEDMDAIDDDAVSCQRICRLRWRAT